MLEKMRVFFASPRGKTVLLLGIVNVLAMATVFSIAGFLNDKIDTYGYVAQIDAFRAGHYFSPDDPVATFRLFKPLYGVVGGLLAGVVPPQVAILLINIALFGGLTVCVYRLLEQLGFARRFACVGTLWVMTGYPMLKYGLALGTDISGWFFATATVVATLAAAARKDVRYIVLASCLGFLGSMSKETGVVGLVFAGIFILMHGREWGVRKTAGWLAALCVPFFALQGAFLAALQAAGAPTFLEWYLYNRVAYAEGFYTLPYFVAIIGSAFHVVLLFALGGAIVAIRTRDLLRAEWQRKYVPLLVAALPVLLWPVFVSRILFVQFLFIVPLALYGLAAWEARGGSKRVWGVPVVTWACALPPLVSLGLYVLAGTGSLFVRVADLLR